jgi:hypothetical protein
MIFYECLSGCQFCVNKSYEAMSVYLRMLFEAIIILLAFVISLLEVFSLLFYFMCDPIC